MQPRLLLLSLSLVANIVLAALVLRTPSTSPTSGDTPAPFSSTGSRTNDHTPSHASSALYPPHGQTNRSQPITDSWSQLYSEDPDQLASRLKASGFSYREIRAIVSTLLQQKFEAARAQVQGERDAAPYWRASSFYAVPEDPAKRAKLMELMQKESRAYQKIFASPEALAEDQQLRRYAERRFGDLPLEKLQQLSKVQSDYDELQSDVYMKAQTRPKPELTTDERKQLKLLESELQRDLQQALSPEQYTEYLLRNSPTANNLRTQLELFRPTEAEYKALFALQRPLDEQFSQQPDGDNTFKARSEAIKKLEPQIQAALGRERYADYKQALESGGDKVARLVVRLDLPLATVGKINIVRDDITQRAKSVRDDKQLTPAERDLRLSALANEAKTKLTTTLGGQRGLEAYADIKGDWLRALQPKPATP